MNPKIKNVNNTSVTKQSTMNRMKNHSSRKLKKLASNKSHYTIDLNHLTQRSLLRILSSNQLNKNKLNYEETVAIWNYLVKNQPNMVYSIIDKKYFIKFKDLIPKLSRLTSFQYTDSNYILLNTKPKVNEEVFLLSGNIAQLSLVRKLVNISYNDYFEYMKKMKINREEEIFRKCLKLNPESMHDILSIHLDVAKKTNENKRNTVIISNDVKNNSNSLIKNTCKNVKQFIKDFQSPIPLSIELEEFFNTNGNMLKYVINDKLVNQSDMNLVVKNISKKVLNDTSLISNILDDDNKRLIENTKNSKENDNLNHNNYSSGEEIEKKKEKNSNRNTVKKRSSKKVAISLRKDSKKKLSSQENNSNSIINGDNSMINMSGSKVIKCESKLEAASSFKHISFKESNNYNNFDKITNLKARNNKNKNTNNNSFTNSNQKHSNAHINHINNKNSNSTSIIVDHEELRDNIHELKTEENIYNTFADKDKQNYFVYLYEDIKLIREYDRVVLDDKDSTLFTSNSKGLSCNNLIRKNAENDNNDNNDEINNSITIENSYFNNDISANTNKNEEKRINKTRNGSTSNMNSMHMNTINTNGSNKTSTKTINNASESFRNNNNNNIISNANAKENQYKINLSKINNTMSNSKINNNNPNNNNGGISKIKEQLIKENEANSSTSRKTTIRKSTKKNTIRQRKSKLRTLKFDNISNSTKNHVEGEGVKNQEDSALEEEDNEAERLKRKHDIKKFTLITTDPVYLMILPTYELQIIIREMEENLFKQELLHFLRRCYIFNKIDDLVLKDIIVRYFKEETYNSGDVLFKENDVIQNIYFLRKGSVELSIKNNAINLKKLSCKLSGFSYYPEIIDENSSLFKRLNLIKQHNIMHSSENTILGLRNIMFPNTQQVMFTGEVSSKTLEVLKISKSDFNKIYKMYFEIRNIVKDFEKQLSLILINRVNEIYESIYDSRNILHKSRHILATNDNINNSIGNAGNKNKDRDMYSNILNKNRSLNQYEYNNTSNIITFPVLSNKYYIKKNNDDDSFSNSEENNKNDSLKSSLNSTLNNNNNKHKSIDSRIMTNISIGSRNKKQQNIQFKSFQNYPTDINEYNHLKEINKSIQLPKLTLNILTNQDYSKRMRNIEDSHIEKENHKKRSSNYNNSQGNLNTQEKNKSNLYNIHNIKQKSGIDKTISDRTKDRAINYLNTQNTLKAIKMKNISNNINNNYESNNSNNEPLDGHNTKSNYILYNKSTVGIGGNEFYKYNNRNFSNDTDDDYDMHENGFNNVFNMRNRKLSSSFEDRSKSLIDATIANTNSHNNKDNINTINRNNNANFITSKHTNNKNKHFTNNQRQDGNSNRNINHNDKITNVTNINIINNNYIITPTSNNNIRKFSINNSYIKNPLTSYNKLDINSIIYKEKLNNELTKSSMLLNKNQILSSTEIADVIGKLNKSNNKNHSSNSFNSKNYIQTQENSDLNMKSNKNNNNNLITIDYSKSQLKDDYLIKSITKQVQNFESIKKKNANKLLYSDINTHNYNKGTVFKLRSNNSANKSKIKNINNYKYNDIKEKNYKLRLIGDNKGSVNLYNKTIIDPELKNVSNHYNINNVKLNFNIINNTKHAVNYANTINTIDTINNKHNQYNENSIIKSQTPLFTINNKEVVYSINNKNRNRNYHHNFNTLIMTNTNNREKINSLNTQSTVSMEKDRLVKSIGINTNGNAGNIRSKDKKDQFLNEFNNIHYKHIINTYNDSLANYEEINNRRYLNIMKTDNTNRSINNNNENNSINMQTSSKNNNLLLPKLI